MKTFQLLSAHIYWRWWWSGWTRRTLRLQSKKWATSSTSSSTRIYPSYTARVINWVSFVRLIWLSDWGGPRCQPWVLGGRWGRDIPCCEHCRLLQGDLITPQLNHLWMDYFSTFPQTLQQLGLVHAEVDVADEEANINILFDLALQRLAFLSFSYIADKFKLAVKFLSHK